MNTMNALQHDPHLTSRLKQLRLSGMLETLDVRMRQAVDEQLSYVDFLQQLLEDEIERRNHKHLQLRLRRAGFQADKTLERFDFSFNPQLNKQLILELATCQFVAKHQPVIVVGPSGVGKSHLSQALGWEACKRGYDVAYTNCAKLLASLAAGRVDGSFDRRMQTIVRPQLLILDDFGLKPLRAPSPEDMFDIISERYEKGATIITSNRAQRVPPTVRQRHRRHHHRQLVPRSQSQQGVAFGLHIGRGGLTFFSLL